jgi:hypothetical protein
MTRNVAAAELEVYTPANSGTDPDTVIPGVDVEQLTINSRLQDLIDTGRIALTNDRGTYTDAITSGDRLRFKTQLDGEDALSHRWTGLARPVTHAQTGPTTTQLELRVDDFVFGVLDMRSVVNAFEGDPIAGSEDAVLNRILKRNAPEIDRSQIATVSEEVNIVWTGKSLLDAVRDLADRADAIVSQDETSLVFERLGTASTEWTLTPADKGLHKVKENDDSLANEIRVEGGEGVEIDAEQTTVDGYETVSDGNRIQTQIRTRKSEVTRIELWTRTTGSGDNVVVRLQADQDGAPKDPSSRESDIARKTLSSDFLANDDWTTFLLPEHKLPDRDPWLMIESDGSTGQEIGVDTASSDPAHRAYYPYPLATILSDADSIDEYRRRERIIQKDSLKTRQQTNEVAKSAIRHSRKPARTIEFPAESVRAHNLKPGDVIGVDEPAERAVGNFVVVERRDSYGGVNLTTDIVAQDIDTI